MKTMILRLMAGILACMLVSCSATDEEEQNRLTKKPTEETSSMKMNFQVDMTVFDDHQATRAGDNWTWNDGAVVYLQFHDGTSRVSGYAVYHLSTTSWEAFWNGTIGTHDKCEVYFFEGASTDDKHSVSLNANQAVYADKAGAYMVNGSELTIQANLKPLTSRIRFTGANGLGYEVEGLTYYTGYDADNNQLTSSSSSIIGQVGTTLSTPYYYCVFTDASKRELSVINSVDDAVFTKTFDTSVLRVGESGYITIPTVNANKGWNAETLDQTEKKYIVTGNGQTVTFKMITITGGTFRMGSDDWDDYEKPVHSVTLADYMIGETEVTQELWQAVMGSNPANFKGEKRPVERVPWDDCQKFIQKLNALTGQRFRLPTEAEWEFAARGGNQSMGYKYAGSNSIDEVAWYNENSSSTTHDVNTKAPNELGLYDMSGNVWEWCQDWYGNYSSDAKTNPTGPSTGSYRVHRGGSWNYSAWRCRVSDRNFDAPSYSYTNVGFRLAQ